MTLVTRSTPFCKPAAQHARPMTMTTIIQKISSPGFESNAPNTLPTPSAVWPTNAPVALLYTYASIQPATTV